MFFDCVVVVEVWKIISSLTSIDAHVTYESVAIWRVSNKKKQANNLVHVASLWAIWRCRNDMCFNKNTWLALHAIPRKILCVEGAKEHVKEINASVWVSASSPMLMLPEPY